MDGPERAKLGDGRRWHFQHGPIDLILEAFGEPAEVQAAYNQAWQGFETMLKSLVEELPLLRRAVGDQVPPVGDQVPPTWGRTPPTWGRTARRMVAAVWPHRQVFVTPMAAVAGAVADEVLGAMVAGRRLQRAYVNDGGDIAIWLAPGQRFETGIVTNPLAPSIDGAITITADMPVRGIATSGRGGRSLTLGIADSVTVLAKDAAAADVAATLIANAIDIEDPAIERRPAAELDPDSDLGDQLVTVSVGALDESSVDEALGHGVRRAEEMRLSGLIEAALMSLAGQTRYVSPSLVRIQCQS
jgi:ApbE superfamily uncharacterized protein (UPF0280 family)